MRGVIKKRKYFQFFFKKKNIIIIFIKVILFCLKFKNFFFFKNINFFFNGMFSCMLYNTFFFINAVFFYNSQSTSIPIKNFFFNKKKLKKFTGNNFIFFFKKFLRKKRLSFKKTIFNRLQIQKLSDNQEDNYLIRWVRVYHNYINIFSSGYKLWLLRRIFFKRKRVRDFDIPKRKLRNWVTLKQFYEVNEWTDTNQTSATPMSILFLLTYYAFFQKKKILRAKQKLFYFRKYHLGWFGFFRQLFYLHNFFDFFFIKKKIELFLLQQHENIEIYFSYFFKKKNFFENVTNITLSKNTFFFFKKLFYTYNYCLGVFSRFSLSWSNLRKCSLDDNILFCPTHKQFFFFLKIIKKLKRGAKCFFFFKKLHCALNKLGYIKNKKFRRIRRFYKKTVFNFFKKKKNFNAKILFLYKRFRFSFFKKLVSFQKFFGNIDYLTNIRFYVYLLFTPDIFIGNYVLNKNKNNKNLCNKYTNLLPIFFKSTTAQKMDEPIEQSLNIYTIYTWYVLNIAELKFKKKIFMKVCNIRRFFLKIKFKKLYKSFKLIYRSYKYKIRKHFSFKQIFHIIILCLCFKDTTLFMNWFTKTLTKLKYRFVKVFLYFLKSSLLNFFLPKVGKPNGVTGFIFDIRGKVGVTGDAKKRHTKISWGNPSYTTKNSRFSLKQGLVHTHTGVMGVTTIITH